MAEERDPWDSLEEWIPAPTELGPITRTDIVRYQGASGDFNPVHHDETFALASGYPAPLAVGMYTVGVMNTWAVHWLGPDNVRRTRARWKAPVWPGDVLTIAGRVSRRLEEGEEQGVEVEVRAIRKESAVGAPSGEEALVATVWVTFVRGS